MDAGVGSEFCTQKVHSPFACTVPCWSFLDWHTLRFRCFWMAPPKGFALPRTLEIFGFPEAVLRVPSPRGILRHTLPPDDDVASNIELIISNPGLGVHLLKPPGPSSSILNRTKLWNGLGHEPKPCVKSSSRGTGQASNSQ